MNPTSFKETNQVLGAGDNPNTEQLPIAYCLNDQIPGRVFVVSKWKLSPEEIQRINETGELWISIMSTTIAPILPMVHNPFTEAGYEPIKFE